LTLKVVSESRVTWATPVPILVFLGLSVLELGPMYAIHRQTSDRQTSDRRQTKASLNASALWERRHNNTQRCQAASAQDPLLRIADGRRYDEF